MKCQNCGSETNIDWGDNNAETLCSDCWHEKYNKSNKDPLNKQNKNSALLNIAIFSPFISFLLGIIYCGLIGAGMYTLLISLLFAAVGGLVSLACLIAYFLSKRRQ
jgi:hypothetical protein